ncbi:MAG: nucleotidyltransferase domain-containing protein [Bryobacteraceae bacterium]
MGRTLGNPLFGITRQSVLGLLFGRPDERFYQRRIIQALSLGSGSVQRELEQLRQAGILTRTVEGRQTYFQARRECPIFDELHALVRKTFGLSRVLSEGLDPLQNQITVAFVFGSAATGTETLCSDVDLMVIGDLSLMDVVAALSDAQRELGREVNPNVYPRVEFCRKLAAGQHFLNSVIGGPKIFLIGDERQLKGLAEIRVAEGTQDKPRRDRRPAGRG